MSSPRKRITSFFSPIPTKKETANDQQAATSPAITARHNKEPIVKNEITVEIESQAAAILAPAIYADVNITTVPLVNEVGEDDLYDIEKLSSPYHPDDTRIIPVQELKGGKCLHFQKKWFDIYPWLHYSQKLNTILCFYCAKVCGDSKNLHWWAKNTDPSFVSNGYRNWKNALGKSGKFEKHQKSHTHFLAVNHYSQQKKQVSSQLCLQNNENQMRARKCLQILFTSLRYLSTQGQALRGHTNELGNLQNLLLLRSEDNNELGSWLERHNSYISPAIQNEMLELMANNVLRKWIEEIQSVKPLMYAFIMDGTTDITTTEQQSCCIRYVDKEFNPQEVFIGMYSPNETTGKELCRVIEEVLLRLNLPLSEMRAQTYDGASNMSGAHLGCQSLIRENNSLALYVHCGAHCTNLVMESVVNATPLVRDSIQWVHELGVLAKQSRKFKTIFAQLAKNTEEPEHMLRPLCPTRWTVRAGAIRITLSQYGLVLDALSELANNGSSNSKTKANGLLDRFTKGNTLLGLKMAIEVFELLENLNSSLQGRKQTVAGMMDAMLITLESLKKLRQATHLTDIIFKAKEEVQILDLEPIQRPRPRRIPKKLGSGYHCGENKTDDDYFRAIYFEMIDTALVCLRSRFDQPAFHTLKILENTLLKGVISENEVEQVNNYPEINIQKLKIQLPMFRCTYKFTSVAETADIFRGLTAEVRALFSEVENLLRLLLVVPVSSCEAERSFSALRRLKTYLRNSMTQKRLNNLLVCHVHREAVLNLNIYDVMRQFIDLNDSRLRTFGGM